MTPNQRVFKERNLRSKRLVPRRFVKAGRRELPTFPACDNTNPYAATATLWKVEVTASNV